MKRIALAADHAGWELYAWLRATPPLPGWSWAEVLREPAAAEDYPWVAAQLGRWVLGQKAGRGILICGSGVGAAIAAGKISGIWAAVCHDTYSARQGVEHDGMNVLCLGARVIGLELARELIAAFLNAKISNAARHLRRRSMVKDLEDSRSAGQWPGWM
jgi:RpiB/LacA/LacB family sugar-phosphate isomerase